MDEQEREVSKMWKGISKEETGYEWNVKKKTSNEEKGKDSHTN